MNYVERCGCGASIEVADDPNLRALVAEWRTAHGAVCSQPRRARYVPPTPVTFPLATFGEAGPPITMPEVSTARGGITYGDPNDSTVRAQRRAERYDQTSIGPIDASGEMPVGYDARDGAMLTASGGWCAPSEAVYDMTLTNVDPSAMRLMMGLPDDDDVLELAHDEPGACIDGDCEECG